MPKNILIDDKNDFVAFAGIAKYVDKVIWYHTQFYAICSSPVLLYPWRCPLSLVEHRTLNIFLTTKMVLFMVLTLVLCLFCRLMGFVLGWCSFFILWCRDQCEIVQQHSERFEDSQVTGVEKIIWNMTVSGKLQTDVILLPVCHWEVAVIFAESCR